MKKEIKKHTEEYIHIRKPNLKAIGNFFLGLILLILSYFSIRLIIIKWKMLGLNVLINCEENCNQFANIMQLDICFNLIITSILIFFGILSLFNLYNKINWADLIWGLIFGLIWGLIVGLFLGLIWGLIFGLIWGLIWGLIFGLIWGLIWGLIVD